jgi:Cu/Zn superoxide dismutase
MFDATSGNTTITLAMTNVSSLVALGNGFHVHQFGLDDVSTSCADTGKHYNPILNYGELAGKLGTIPGTGVYSVVANWLMFDGEYNILGRSLVIHDNTSTRVGCCTIMLKNETTPADGYSGSVLKARFPGAVSVTLFTSAGEAMANVTVTNLTNVDNTIDIHAFGPCPATSEDLGAIVLNNNTVVTDMLVTVDVNNVGTLAGRVSNLHPDDVCVPIIQTAAQANIYDTYNTSTEASTNTTAATNETTTTATNATTTTATTTTAATNATTTTATNATTTTTSNTTSATTTTSTTSSSSGSSTTSSSSVLLVSLFIMVVVLLF